MSITITAEHTGFIGFVIACCDGSELHAPRYGSAEDAKAALALIPGGTEFGCEDIRPVLPGCEMPETCPERPLMVAGVRGEEPPEVEMNNRNAAHIFDALGLPGVVDAVAGGDCGDLAAEDLLGRVLMARGLAPYDESIPASQDGPRWIEGGRREGYLHERLVGLENLARWCAERGLRVVWS